MQSTDTGVTVTCSDGSSFDSTTVIGADGVHSNTRRLMRDLALKEDPLRD
jgi:2-polyprenyl-6-methoxyphenol hydroxylase-like FAD-dependent oxidoreductase